MTVKITRWAYTDDAQGEVYAIEPHDEPGTFVTMHGANAVGRPLVSNGDLGVDLISLQAGDSFNPHTHPGHHVLIVVRGTGTITMDGEVWPTQAGFVYLVPGGIPHAVGSITDHEILAVGAPHKYPDDPERMHLVEYQAVATQFGSLTCHACNPAIDVLPGECPHVPADWGQS